MKNNENRRSYTLPLKIDNIVKDNLDRVRERRAFWLGGEGCPLAITMGHLDYSHLDEGDRLEMMVGGLSGWARVRKSVVEGCYALRDPCCYLEGPSRKQPRVNSKEECPVYNRVMEILQENPLPRTPNF